MKSGDLPIDIAGVVSNHDDCRELVAYFGVPFILIPVTPETKAEADGDHWRINGMKHFITSGRVADLLIVIATTGRTEKGKNEISEFIMMKDQVTPVRKSHTNGMRASRTAEVQFSKPQAGDGGERGRGGVRLSRIHFGVKGKGWRDRADRADSLSLPVRLVSMRTETGSANPIA